MLVLMVYCHVKPEYVEDFKAATLENARNSIQEAGCFRFDVVQQEDDANRFALVEIYRSPEGHAAHRETAHYLKWQATTADMFAEPRTRTRYNNLFPTDWE